MDHNLAHALVSALALGTTLLVGAPASSAPVATSGERCYLALTYEAGGYAGDEVLLINMAREKDAASRWARTWGTSQYEEVKAVTCDAQGNIIIVGDYPMPTFEEYVATPAFVVKFDQYGNVLWSRLLGWSDHSMHFEDVTTDPAGNVYLTGNTWYFTGPPDETGGYPIAGFVYTAKLSASGDPLWAKRLTSHSDACESGQGIAVDGNTVYVAAEAVVIDGGVSGVSLLHYSANDGATGSTYVVLPSDYASFNPVAATLDYSGAFVVCGTAEKLNEAGTRYDPELLLLSLTGDTLIVQCWGSNNPSRPYDICAIGEDVVVAGSVTTKYVPYEPGSTYEIPYNDDLLLMFSDSALVQESIFHDMTPAATGSEIYGVAALGSSDIVVYGLGPWEVEKWMLPAKVLSDSWFPGWYNGGGSWWEDEECAMTCYEPEGWQVATPLAAEEIGSYVAGRHGSYGVMQFAEGAHIPAALLTADPLTGVAPLTVSFSAAGSTCDPGSIAGYTWDWNVLDGASFDFDSGSTATAVHKYDAPGLYKAAVRVTSDDGSEDYAIVDVQVGS